MATVTGYTAARMKAIEDSSVVEGYIDSATGHLILVRYDESTIDAGPVAGTEVMTVEDTATVDMHVTGAGTEENPWKFSADVKTIPASKVDTGVFVRDRIPAMTVMGTLKYDYRVGGLASVLIDGDAVHTDNIPWAVEYIPWHSRRVSLTKFGTSWAITGQVSNEGSFGGHRTWPLTLGTSWVTYNNNVAETDWAEPKVTQLPSGLVVFSGLIRYTNGVPAAGSDVVINLPSELWPEHIVVHHVNNSDTAKTIDITPTGKLQVRGPWQSNGYISLDGLAYWPAGTAVWTTVPAGDFSSSFEATASDTTSFGAPAYYKDPYGFVWFRGVVRVKTGVTVSADNTNIFMLPASHRASGEQHIRACGTGTDGYAGVGARVGDGLNWKANSPSAAGSWISLGGVNLITTDAISLNRWTNMAGFANGWVVHPGGTWPTPSITRRGDGLCASKGLISEGSLGTGRAFVVTQEAWPKNGRLILDGMGNNQRLRLDLSGVMEYAYESGRRRGGMSLLNGPTAGAWCSLDGLVWVN